MSRLLLLIAASTCLMGCILRDFDYEAPPNLPPSVHGTTESPMDRILDIRLDEEPGGDGGASTDLVFIANVRDANVADELRGLAFLDRNQGMTTPVQDFVIPAEQDGSPRDRRAEVRIPLARIAGPGCHSVELHVSRDFVDFANPRPADPEDLGIGIWWIAATNAGTLSVDMVSCQ